MKRLILIIFVIFFCSVLLSCDQGGFVSLGGSVHLEVIDFGVYRLEGERVSEKNSADTAGYRSRVKKGSRFVLLEETDKIPLRKGTIFGFNFILHNLPKLKESTIF